MTSPAEDTRIGSGKIVLVGAVIIAVAAVMWQFGFRNPSGGTTSIAGADLSRQERKELYLAARNKAASLADWPATEQQLIHEFWKAVSEKNWDRVVALCPGGSKEDFIMYDKWTPKPAKAIGPPQPHPVEPGVEVWPVKVPFPGFPNKTIKMAVLEMDNGRLGIDGSHTIWW